MKVVTYKPKEKGFSGTMKIEMPNYFQRLEYYEESKFSIAIEKGAAKAGAVESNIKAMIVLVKKAQEHVKEVRIKFKNIEFNSFEDMLEDSACDPILNEVAGLMISGVSLGGN